MAYLITHFWPGGTEEQYQATADAVHPPGGLPKGQRHHAAGPTEGGYLVSVVWDSKDACDEFVGKTLVPALPSIQGGLVGPPEERACEVAYLMTA